MSYIGENDTFAFRDGYCETLPKRTLTSAEAIRLGRVLAGLFNRFSIGCDSFSCNHILYAIGCGLSECGRNVYISENTDLPSFRFSFPLLSSDCGIYVSGSGNSLKISFFNADRSPFSDSMLERILNAPPAPTSEKNGKLTSVSSFREIYTNNIADSIEGLSSSIPAGISCGNKSIRSLWLEFFSGEDDELVFQISDDGQRVNAYSTKAGFISYEKLLLAAAYKTARKGETVWLPESFHYAADVLDNTEKLTVKRYDERTGVPESAAKQRFFYDPLYMAVHLAADRQSFLKILSELPDLAAAKREITVNSIKNVPLNMSIPDKDGRVIITRSGRNRLSLSAQAHSSETAAELCGSWAEKLRKMCH